MESKLPAEWIPTGEVVVGDRIVCLLADADAYPTVTGWEDVKLAGTAYRNFSVTGAPWWADEGHTSFQLDKTALIVARG